MSFFQYDGESYMLPEDEFRAQVLEQQLDEQGFGGIGGFAG